MKTMRGWAAIGMVAWVAALAGCGGPMSVQSFARQSQGHSIAVVSISINDFGGALQGWNQTRASDLMASRAAAMVGLAEQQLATRFTVVPAGAFVNNPAYQQVPRGLHEVAVPVIDGAMMPVFGQSRGELVSCQVTREQAQALAAAAGTDFVAIIYTEWGVATGGFIPTSKALSKTVMSIYDATGMRVAFQRTDARGERTLGAFGHVVVDENSIDEWVGAYASGLATMLR